MHLDPLCSYCPTFLFVCISPEKQTMLLSIDWECKQKAIDSLCPAVEKPLLGYISLGFWFFRRFFPTSDMIDIFMLSLFKFLHEKKWNLKSVNVHSRTLNVCSCRNINKLLLKT